MALAFTQSYFPVHTLLHATRNPHARTRFPHTPNRTLVKIPQLSMHSREPAFRKVQEAATAQGYTLRNDGVGPLLKICITKREVKEPLAMLSAALLPNRLHVESYKAFQSTASPSLLALSPAMYVFIAALALAADSGSPAVYGLAIDDAPQQHRRLVAYLRRFGGHPVKRVDDSLACVPARVLYGGFGTIIRGDVPQMLDRGLAMIKRQTSLAP